MPHKPDRDGFYVSEFARHYNVRAGDIVLNRIRADALQEIPVASIQSVWCVEEKRELTKEEIKKLCAKRRIN